MSVIEFMGFKTSRFNLRAPEARKHCITVVDDETSKFFRRKKIKENKFPISEGRLTGQINTNH